MFSTENSPNGFSLHRSPPYTSKTPPATSSLESPDTASSPSGRLQLTLKTPYASKVSPVLEKFVDPSPDWTLQDLQLELDVIANRYTSTVSLDNEPPPSTNRGFSWREFSVTADFGRTTGPFRMRAFDSDSETDSGDDEEDDAPSVPTPSVLIEDQIQKATSRNSEEPPAVANEDVWDSSPLLARTGFVESALIELERERRSRVQEEFRKRRLNLDNALREELQREAALLARVENDKEAKCELARRLDKQDQRQMCFCHKKTIDIGFVCSVCLSIFCKHHQTCSTCGATFLKPNLIVITGMKRKVPGS